MYLFFFGKEGVEADLQGHIVNGYQYFCNFDLAKNILVTLKFILQATILRLLLSASCVGLQYTILQ